jgi:hypothetical protein
MCNAFWNRSLLRDDSLPIRKRSYSELLFQKEIRLLPQYGFVGAILTGGSA